MSTDSFAHIIAERKRKADEFAAQEQRWRDFDERSRRDTTWCWLVFGAVVVFVIAVTQGR